jgi:hypothetical protein
VAGSKLVGCVLGSMDDRRTATPLDQHIENCVKTLRAVRTRAQDAGLKIAVENHAGDLQARELKMLIEAAGKDTVGACLDSGNPVWALEDPHLTLETLAPYVLTSHVRDSYLWRTEEGLFVQLCPGKALSMEIICFGPRIFKVQEPQFWEAYQRMPAWEYSRFLNYADRAKPLAPYVNPAKDAVASAQQADLLASAEFTKQVLGL